MEKEDYADNPENVQYKDKAIEAIGSWRESGMDWFYKECNESKGWESLKDFMFLRQIYALSDAGLKEIKCSFGLKYNEVYGKMLVTLIFISFRENLQNAERAQMMSNTYDLVQNHVRLFCRIPGMEG
ncbi:hypothetical protein FQA39_LY19223 [Lamprigera yunnana]|nr:hypothetical protein FQA39_LY19223 [Lamprigera yunnana]